MSTTDLQRERHHAHVLLCRRSGSAKTRSAHPRPSSFSSRPLAADTAPEIPPELLKSAAIRFAVRIAAQTSSRQIGRRSKREPEKSDERKWEGFMFDNHFGAGCVSPARLKDLFFARNYQFLQGRIDQLPASGRSSVILPLFIQVTKGTNGYWRRNLEYSQANLRPQTKGRRAQTQISISSVDLEKLQPKSGGCRSGSPHAGFTSSTSPC